MKIYLVKAEISYEGDTHLAVFRDKSKAEKLLKECEEVKRLYVNGDARQYYDFCKERFGEGKYLGDCIEIEEMELVE